MPPRRVFADERLRVLPQALLWSQNERQKADRQMPHHRRRQRRTQFKLSPAGAFARRGAYHEKIRR